MRHAERLVLLATTLSGRWCLSDATSRHLQGGTPGTCVYAEKINGQSFESGQSATSLVVSPLCHDAHDPVQIPSGRRCKSLSAFFQRELVAPELSVAMQVYQCLFFYPRQTCATRISSDTNKNFRSSVRSQKDISKKSGAFPLARQ